MNRAVKVLAVKLLGKEVDLGFLKNLRAQHLKSL